MLFQQCVDKAVSLFVMRRLSCFVVSVLCRGGGMLWPNFQSNPIWKLPAGHCCASSGGKRRRRPPEQRWAEMSFKFVFTAPKQPWPRQRKQEKKRAETKKARKPGVAHPHQVAGKQSKRGRFWPGAQHGHAVISSVREKTEAHGIAIKGAKVGLAIQKSTSIQRRVAQRIRTEKKLLTFSGKATFDQDRARGDEEPPAHPTARHFGLKKWWVGLAAIVFRTSTNWCLCHGAFDGPRRQSPRTDQNVFHLQHPTSNLKQGLWRDGGFCTRVR